MEDNKAKETEPSLLENATNSIKQLNITADKADMTSYDEDKVYKSFEEAKAAMRDFIAYDIFHFISKYEYEMIEQVDNVRGKYYIITRSDSRKPEKPKYGTIALPAPLRTYGGVTSIYDTPESATLDDDLEDDQANNSIKQSNITAAKSYMKEDSESGENVATFLKGSPYDGSKLYKSYEEAEVAMRDFKAYDSFLGLSTLLYYIDEWVEDETEMYYVISQYDSKPKHRSVAIPAIIRSGGRGASPYNTATSDDDEVKITASKVHLDITNPYKK